jgi:hypothetical protein
MLIFSNIFFVFSAKIRPNLHSAVKITLVSCLLEHEKNNKQLSLYLILIPKTHNFIMKKIVLTLICIISMFAAKAQCNYTLEANDSWGDGWNGGSMDVLVDGVVVLNDVAATFQGGGGTASSELFPFPVTAGLNITTIWNASGSFPGEISWRILDSGGTAVFSGLAGDEIGDGGNPPILTVCPACISPNSLDVTGIAADGATLEWTDGNAPSAGFEYEIVDITAGGTQNMTGIAEATTSVTVSGLTSGGNQYEFYVRADCGASVFSDWAGPFAWYQGTPPGSDCANAIVATPGVFNDVFVADGFGGASQIDATNSLWYSFTPAEDGTMNIGSCMSAPGDVDTRLWAWADGCGTLTAVVGDDDGCDAPNNFGSTVVGVPVIGGTEYLIEWDDRWENTNPFDWELTYNPIPAQVPGCAENLMPADLSMNQNGALTFTWDPAAGGVTDSYDYYLGTSSPPPFFNNVATNSIRLTGFALETTYYWQVVSKNALGDAVGCDIFELTTKSPPSGPVGLMCGVGNQSASQFTESFDSTATGWTGNVSNGTTTSGIWNFGRTGVTPSGNTGPSAGEDGDYMYYEGSNGNTLASAVSPVIDLSAIDPSEAAELSFYMHAYGFYMQTLNVGAATTAAGPFTNIFSWSGPIQISPAEAWLQVGVDVSDFTGGDLFLEFSYQGIDTNGTQVSSDMSIDSLEVSACETAPSCLAPTALDVTGIAADGATLEWTDANAPSAGFEYEIVDITAGGSQTMTGIAEATTSVTVSGLTSGGNQYEFYVRADCGAGGFSSWAGPFAWTQVDIVAGGVDCASAVAVVEGSYTSQVAGDGTNNTSDEAWFVFTAMTGGTLTVDSCPPSTDTRLSIFNGCASVMPYSPGPNGNDDSCGLGSSLDFEVLAGQDYVIRWDDRWSDSVLFDWNVSFTPSCPGITTTWNGTVWDNGAPGTNDYAIILGTYSTDDGDLDVCSLQVDGLLTVESDDFVRSGGDINVTQSGGIDVAPTGSVVQIATDAATNNDGAILVATITPVMGARSFMISGSPMTGEIREGVYGNSYIVRDHVTANFVPHPDVELIAAGLNNWADDDGDNWLIHTGGINPGEGYMVFPQPDDVTSGTFGQAHTTGTLNSGMITFNMGYNGMPSNSPNMMANPYASAIDAELFFDDPANGDINEVYFWEHLTPLSAAYPGYNVANFNMGDISIYSESLGGVMAANGGATPTQFISTGQGFGVKPLAGGIAEFNNAMRITGPNDTYRSSNVNRDRIWMNVYNDSYGLGSTALIGFTENNLDGYNKSEDIDRLPTPVSLYSELETGEELVVNALGTFETSDDFYLSFSTQVKETQDYRISIQNMDGVNFENTTVYIIDSLTGIVTNLTEGDYTFESWKAVYSRRFKVVFENSALGINGSNLDSVSLYPNPTQNIVTIVSPNAMLISAKVHDIRGRLVSVVDFTNQSTYRVDLSTMEVGVYFIGINTENGTVTKRVIKRE